MGGRGAASGGGRAQGRRVSWAEAQQMRVRMGQRGTEGAGFVQTSKSWNINAFLRGDPDFNDASGWDMSETEIMRTVRRMDAGMRPLPETIQTVRFVDGFFLEGIGVDGRIGDRTTSAVRRRFQNDKTLTTSAFTSVSTDVRQNVFTGRPVKLNVTVKKGAKAIITTNQQESEIVLGRNQKWTFTGVRQPRRGQLEIDFTIG